MSLRSANENPFCDAFGFLAEIIVWPLQRDVDCDWVVTLFARQLLKVFTRGYDKFRMYVSVSSPFTYGNLLTQFRPSCRYSRSMSLGRHSVALPFTVYHDGLPVLTLDVS
jgi:hypothetical protein